MVLPDRADGPRVALCQWRPSDAAALHLAIQTSREHLRPWMAWAGDEPATIEDLAVRIDRWERDQRAGGDAMYAMNVGGTVIGGCGLHRRSAPHILEIGYWLHVDHLGQGYAREAAAVLTTLALSIGGITRVEIHHDAANIASRRVPEALGYHRDGETPDEIVAPGEVGIDVAWSMTAVTWFTESR